MTTSTTTPTETAVLRPALHPQVSLLLQTAALFILFVGLFAYLQFATPGLPDTDGYYHAKMGWLIRQEGLTPDFPWLPLTILNPEQFYDHHLLYHVYLSLFATTDPAVDGGLALVRGAKIAAVIPPALAFLAVWWLLRAQRVPFASLWALALFALSNPFLYRLSMIRAQAASLLVLVLALHWLLNGRYYLLLPLGFLYVWLYNAFPLLLLIAGVYVVAILMLERRFVWQALVYPAAGLALGIIINPYFPENITFIINHLLPKIGDSAVRVGNEWYPYETWTLVENSGFSLAAFVLGTFALGWRARRFDKATLVAFALAVLFGLMLFKSRRFVEYYPAFALLFLVFSAAPLLADWQARRPFSANLLALSLLLLLALPLALTLSQTHQTIANTRPPDLYADAVAWLRRNAPSGTMVFQTDWDDFTRLFFYNSDAIYTVGLDLTYLQLHDADLYEEWVSITRGEIEQPGALIRDRFGAGYVFSDLNHDDFIEEATADPLLQEVYRDKYAVIFQVMNHE